MSSSPNTTAAVASVAAIDLPSIAASPMTPSSSAASSSSNVSAPELAMWSAATSRRSSIRSSFSSVAMAVSASADSLAKPELLLRPYAPLQQQQHHPQRAPLPSQNSLRHKTDPLSRTYPAPEGELDVAEALRREPRKWTLGYWAKNAKDLPLSPSPTVPSPAATSASLEQKKQELRQAQQDLEKAAAATQRRR